MNKILWKLFGSRVARRAMEKHTQSGGLLDAGLGFALLRDRRVPIGSKLIALAIGTGMTALLINLELPLEAALALLVPFLGLAADAAIDGMEAVIGPALITCLLLPHLAPKAMVAQIRAERAGLGSGTVIDVESYEPHPKAESQTKRVGLRFS